MFSSNDNVNINIDPSIVSNYHSDESILNCNRPVFNDIIFPYPYSKSQQDNYCPLSSSSSSSFFQFPCIPYTHHGLDIHDDPHNSHQFPQHHPSHDHDLLLLQQQPPPPVPTVDSTGEERITTVPGKKRSLKRDRHSKINTAKGPRDRRMRLSLEVAKQFFGLQDFLGFDKASKTVEWLLIQAKPEIKKLEMAKGTQFQIYSGGAKSNSSTSDCEVVSGSDEAATKESTHKSKRKRIPSNKGKKIRKCREVAVRLHAKDSREKARERARARTREKNQRQKVDESKLCCLIDEANTKNNDINNNNLSNSNEMNQLSSWSSFETAGEESGTQSMQLHDEQLGGNFNQEGEGIVDESYMMGSPSVFNYLPNIGIPVQEHQFQDIQFFVNHSKVCKTTGNLC